MTGRLATSESWEYQPLGPFLGKSFATSVSPFVVPMEALLPYRVAPEPRATNDPQPLLYLASTALHAIDLTVEVFLTSTRMREASQAPHRLSTGNLRDLYWTFPQMIAHHTSNGCNLVEGDLLASGTISRSPTRLARLPPRNHPARRQANPTPQRRTTHLSRRRRRSHSSRLLQTRGLSPHQLRRMPGTIAPIRRLSKTGGFSRTASERLSDLQPGITSSELRKNLAWTIRYDADRLD